MDVTLRDVKKLVPADVKIERAQLLSVAKRMQRLEQARIA